MLDRQLHKFYISYRLDGKVHLEWIEGINLRHAKEKIEVYPPGRVVGDIHAPVILIESGVIFNGNCSMKA